MQLADKINLFIPYTNKIRKGLYKFIILSMTTLQRSSIPTISLYGVQDINDTVYPYNVHDHSLVGFEKGTIVNFLQLERYTRHKYDNKLHRYIDQLLREEKWIIEPPFDMISVDHMVGRSFISGSGKIRSEGMLTENLQNVPEKGKGWWFNQPVQTYTLAHELAHIYSCLPFYGDFKDNSLLVHFDGGASKSNFSAWLWKNNTLCLLESHWQLKWLTDFFNANALTFSIVGGNVKNQNSVPGKLMGLAAYGCYDPLIESWLKKHDFFKDIWGHKQFFLEQVYRDWGITLNGISNREPFIQNIAATVQYIFERECLNVLERLKKQTEADYLYFTGGSALNIKLNTRIVNAQLFQDVYVPPCPNDTGLAVGAGACMEYHKHGGIHLHSPYLNNWGITDYVVDLDRVRIQRVAEWIAGGKVVGIMNGYGEIGPRALGNRSILAKADSEQLARKVSMEQKEREWYRPLAPVMLYHNALYFTQRQTIPWLSQYMLMEFAIPKEYQPEIEGAVHVDGTSRIQTVFTSGDNPFLYELLQILEIQYGIRALLNTSFNAKEEPIVHTRADARKTAHKMGLDAVVINGHFYPL